MHCCCIKKFSATPKETIPFGLNLQSYSASSRAVSCRIKAAKDAGYDHMQLTVLEQAAEPVNQRTRIRTLGRSVTQFRPRVALCSNACMVVVRRANDLCALIFEWK